MRIFDLVMDTGIPSDKEDCLRMFANGDVWMSGSMIFDHETPVPIGASLRIRGTYYIYEGVDAYRVMFDETNNRWTARTRKVGSMDESAKSEKMPIITKNEAIAIAGVAIAMILYVKACEGIIARGVMKGNMRTIERMMKAR